LFWRLGRQLQVGGDRAEVGDDAQDTLSLLSAVGVDGVGVVRLDFSVGVGCLGRRGRIGRLRGLWKEQSAGCIGQIDDGQCWRGIVFGGGQEAG